MPIVHHMASQYRRGRDQRNRGMNIQSLIQLGGSEWKKDGSHRIYFNFDELVDFVGLQVTRYGSGNVSSAKLDGEKISNARAVEMLSMLRVAKFYYDVPSGEFRFNMGDTRSMSGPKMASRIKASILARLDDQLS